MIPGLLKILKTHSLSAAALAVFLGALCGCGGSEPSGSVQGTVTLKGKPLEDGQVLLFAEPGRPVSAAAISANGVFQFAEPIPAGKYAVAILPAGEELPAGAEPPSVKTALPQIPPKYRSEVTSGLNAAIQPGDNALTFQMK